MLSLKVARSFYCVEDPEKNPDPAPLPVPKLKFVDSGLDNFSQVKIN